MKNLKDYLNSPLGQAMPKEINSSNVLVPQGHELSKKDLGWWDKRALAKDNSKLTAQAASELQAADIERRKHLGLLANELIGKQASAAMMASGINNFATLLIEAANRAAVTTDGVTNSEMANVMNHIDTRNQHYRAIDDMLHAGNVTAEEAAFLREYAMQRAGESMYRARERADLAKDSVDDLYKTAIGGINRARETLKHC